MNTDSWNTDEAKRSWSKVTTTRVLKCRYYLTQLTGKELGCPLEETTNRVIEFLVGNTPLVSHDLKNLKVADFSEILMTFMGTREKYGELTRRDFAIDCLRFFLGRLASPGHQSYFPGQWERDYMRTKGLLRDLSNSEVDDFVQIAFQQEFGGETALRDSKKDLAALQHLAATAESLHEQFRSHVAVCLEKERCIPDGLTPAQQDIWKLVVIENGRRMTTNEIDTALNLNGLGQSFGMLKQNLAILSRQRRVLPNRQDTDPPGYGLPEWD